MKPIHYILAAAAILAISCEQKSENPKAVEQQAEKVNPFIGEWVEVGDDNTIKFISQGDTILFNDGKMNFKAEPSGDSSINVDFSSTVLGIVVFEYSKENDSIAALGDTFKRKKSNQEVEQAGTGQPATRPLSDSEGSDKPQPEAEGRSR
jgi:hypothetical protein